MFGSLTCCLFAAVRWFPAAHSRTNIPARSSSEQEEFCIRHFFLEYRKQKELSEGIGIEEDDAADLGNKEEEPNSVFVWRMIPLTSVAAEVPPPSQCEAVDDAGGSDVKAELPLHLSITKDVMERCIHLVSDPALRLRLKVPSFCLSCE